MSTWIYIERQYANDLQVGPYPTVDAAKHAMKNAPLIDGLCEKDCLECYLIDEAPTTQNNMLVDMQDPDHTGVDVKHDAALTILFVKEETPNAP